MKGHDGKIYSTALLGASPTSVKALVETVQHKQGTRAGQHGPTRQTPARMVIKDGMVVVLTAVRR
ncbi:hypothetical protein B0G73_108263 [Paraburkholderia sp. BL25I1N1]|nr:hypothetical protein B0G73_108263 [Paraburkholderia sp. BL25I1N1]